MLSRVFVRQCRSFSATAIANPRLTIAQNFLLLEQIENSTDAASLSNALKSTAVVDVNKLPAGLASMQEFLATPAASSAKGFQADSKAWHNLGAAEYISEEATRDDHFPFILSAM